MPSKAPVASAAVPPVLLAVCDPGDAVLCGCTCLLQELRCHTLSAHHNTCVHSSGWLQVQLLNHKR